MALPPAKCAWWRHKTSYPLTCDSAGLEMRSKKCFYVKWLDGAQALLSPLLGQGCRNGSNWYRNSWELSVLAKTKALDLVPQPGCLPHGKSVGGGEKRPTSLWDAIFYTQKEGICREWSVNDTEAISPGISRRTVRARGSKRRRNESGCARKCLTHGCVRMFARLKSGNFIRRFAPIFAIRHMFGQAWTVDGPGKNV